MKPIALLGIALALFAAVPAGAQDFATGVTAFQRGDYATAIKNWMPLAEKGDAEAQRNVGIMFQQGLGVPQSDVDAVYWYRKAAESGHARAQQNLGVMYQEGAGVPLDYSEAAKWYRMAARGGNVPAKLNLGVMLERGVPGMPLNVIEAHMWYNLAAAQGNAEAAKFRDELALDMSREQIAEAQARAQEWLDQHPQ